MNKEQSNQNHEDMDYLYAYWIPIPPGVRGLKIRIFRKLRQFYQRRFRNRNYIFMKSGPFEPAFNSPCEFARYDSFENIPDFVKESIVLNEGEKRLGSDRFEMNHGAIMWVGFINGNLATCILTRFGKYFKSWFVDLDATDIVYIAGRTYPSYRGRGILSMLILHSMYNLLNNGGNAYLDVNMNNMSSIRAIQKAGFTEIALMKPISKKQSLGVER